MTTGEPAVAITFDACAIRTNGYGFDAAVFDILKRERVPATIFVSGRWVELHPDAMAALVREPLVEFGDHSYDHPHMSRLPAADEIDRTEAALGRYGKHSVAFRPPFGEWSRRLVDVAREKGLPLVTWDVVSGDPSAKTTTAKMIQAVLEKTRPGSIVIPSWTITAVAVAPGGAQILWAGTAGSTSSNCRSCRPDRQAVQDEPSRARPDRAGGRRGS